MPPPPSPSGTQPRGRGLMGPNQKLIGGCLCGGAWVASPCPPSMTPSHCPTPPPPFRREKPNVPAQRSGEPFFQQKRFPGPRISVPGRKHTFLLVVL